MSTANLPTTTDDSGRPRALAVAAMVTGLAYCGWRVTTLGSGWTLALSVPLLITEVWALTHLAMLSIQCWRVPPDQPPPSAAPAGTVPRTDVVITAHLATPDEVERSLVGTTALVGCGRVVVIDATEREDVRVRTDRFHATYLVDPDVVASEAAVAFDNARSALFVWMRGGQVAMPTLLLSLIERFDDPRLAVCQSSVGLMNADSLVHLRGGRDEEALLRDVIGPGLDRLGSAPWQGPASMIRRQAFDEIGGLDRDDPAAVPRALIRMHRAGWESGFDPRQLIRSTAADDLDDYLARRRSHAIEALRIFSTPENPLVTGGLAWQHRLVHVATALSFGTGLRQLAQVAILAAVLVTGRMPFDAPIATLVLLWAVPTMLGVVARHQLARGSMAPGDWVRHGWRTVGADVGALWASFGSISHRRAAPTGPASGLAALGRMRTLTVAVVLVESILVLRALTILSAGLLPRMGTGERVLVLSATLLALAPMVDVLQVVVLRRQRRRHHRLQCALPVVLGSSEATTIDLSPTGVGLILDDAPIVGATTRFALTLPSIVGIDQHIHGTAVVRAADAHQSGRVRVGLEFVNLDDVARLALIAYCAIGHPLQNRSEVPSLSAPSHLDVERKGTHQRSLQALTATAIVGGLAVVAFGPGASAAIADAVAVDRACATTVDGDPVPDAVVEARSAEDWQVLGATGPSGCLAIAAGTTSEDRFAVTYAGGRIESLSPNIDGSTVFLTLQDHRVAVFDSAGQPVGDAEVRYFTDAWHPAEPESAGRSVISATMSPTAVEVTWRGGRRGLPFAPTTTVVLAALRTDDGADVVDIDLGSGWEPYVDGMELLPGRFMVRTADGAIVKLDVPAGHALSVPSGRLALLSISLPTPEPTAGPTATAAPADPEAVPTDQPEPTPEPADPTPEPAEPTPEPAEPTPEPIEPTPEPEQPPSLIATPEPSPTPEATP